MRFAGNVFKDGKFWLAEIPFLDAMTQGRTRKEAFEMAADLVESLIDRADFKATIHIGKKGEFELSGSDTAAMIALLLRRQRETSGLSLSEVAERLGAKSKNAYARYEQGKAVPSIEKLNELLLAVSPKTDFVLRQSNAA